MGKSKNGKYFKGPKGPRKGPADDEDGSEEEEEEVPVQRGIVAQRANVGMLPPSDSDEEEGEEKPKPKAAAPKEGDGASSSKVAAAAPAGQSKTAGKMPPSDSEDDDDESSDDDEPEYLKAAPAVRKKVEVVEVRTEEQIRKDLERLELIKKKREDDRLKRIATDGWDRYAPVTETNKPPGTVPSDHPSNQDDE